MAVLSYNERSQAAKSFSAKEQLSAPNSVHQRSNGMSNEGPLKHTLAPSAVVAAAAGVKGGAGRHAERGKGASQSEEYNHATQTQCTVPTLVEIS